MLTSIWNPSMVANSSRWPNLNLAVNLSTTALGIARPIRSEAIENTELLPNASICGDACFWWRLREHRPDETLNNYFRS